MRALEFWTLLVAILFAFAEVTESRTILRDGTSRHLQIPSRRTSAPSGAPSIGASAGGTRAGDTAGPNNAGSAAPTSGLGSMTPSPTPLNATGLSPSVASGSLEPTLGVAQTVTPLPATGSPAPVEHSYAPIGPTHRNTPAPLEPYHRSTPAPIPSPYNPKPPTFEFPTPNSSPTIPYVPPDDDPIVNPEDASSEQPGWSENQYETLAQMRKDRNVLIALGTLAGVAFVMILVVAQQLIENPEGCCAR